MTWTPRPDWTNVKAAPYNAAGNGTTDDTAAIQAAINHVETGGGGTVYFPPGCYKITSSLEVIGSYPDQVCNLVGYGINTVIKWYGPAGGAMVWANGASVCKYEGFVWDGGGTGGLYGTGGAGCAFLEYSSNPFNSGYSDYMTGIRHENESFRNFTVNGNFTPQGLPPDSLNPSGFPPAAIISGLANPLGSVPVGEVTIVNCKFQYCTTAIYNPVELYNNFMWVMDGCEFDNNGTGFQCGTWGAGGSDFVLMNCHFQGSTVTDIGYGGGIRGLRLTSSGSAAFYTGFMGGAGLQDCWIDSWTNPSYAMSFISSGQARVVDCTFTNPPAGAAPPIALGTQTADTQTMLFSNIVAPNFPSGAGVLNHYGAEPSNANIDWIPAGSMGANVTSPNETFLKSTYPPDATHILDVTAAPYNADTTGTHDTSSAIQAAVNDAAAANNGTCVYLPIGLYRLAATVNCAGSNYSIEGEGFHTEIWWAAGSNGTMFAVSNPQNITFRNFHLACPFISGGPVQDPFYYNDPSHTLPNTDGTTITGILETATGASYATYDSVYYDGCGLGNIWATGGDATGPGLVLSGLPAGSTVYIPFLDSPLTVNDCGQAQIFSMKANIDAVKVSGATLPKTGFLGLAVAEGGVGVGRPLIPDDPTLYNFTVSDDQNLLVGPYYSEQCDNDVNLQGGSGTSPGHVAIEGLNESPSPSSVAINVNNFMGRLFYAQQIFFGGYEATSWTIDPVKVQQTGSNPINMVLADNFFYDADSGAPATFSLGSGANLVATLSESGSNSMPLANLADSPNPLVASDLQLVAQGLDDFRQLGALNLAVEYGQVNPSGLVAYWKLDEPNGPSGDSSMSGITGTWQSGPTFTTDHPGSIPYVDAGSISFNGSGQCINMGNPAGLPTGRSPRTICGWGKANNTDPGWRWIAAYGSPGGSQAMFIGMNGTTLDGGAYGDDLEVPNFWDDNWHFIALTYDGTTAKLYADGTLVASDTRNWNLVPSACYIGEQVNNAGEYWNGNIDDVRIYNRALSATEISQLIGNNNNPVIGPVNPTPFSALGYTPGGFSLNNDIAAGSGVRNLTVVSGGSPFSNDTESMLWVDSTASSTGSGLQASESFPATPVDSPAIQTFDFRINPNGPQTDFWLFTDVNYWSTASGIHICGNGSLSANVNGSDTYLGQLMIGVWYRAQIVLGAPDAGPSNATLYLTPWYGNGAGPTVTYTIEGVPWAMWAGYSGFSMYTGTGPGAQQSINIDNLSIIPDGRLVIPPNTGSTANQLDEETGLVAHWKLDETAGPLSFDSSGEFNTGSWINGPTLSSDGYLTFNGINQYVTMGNPNGLPIGTQARTICGWARSPSSGQNGYGMFASYGSPANGEGFWLGGNGTSLAVGSWGYDLPFVPNVWDGNWHFIALTYDGTTACLYADGVLKESVPETWNLVPSVCYIGCYLNGGGCWNGSVDDVRIYDRALSAAEVSNLAGIPTYDLANDWNTTSDSTSNVWSYGVYGTLGNPATFTISSGAYHNTSDLPGLDIWFLNPSAADPNTEKNVSSSPLYGSGIEWQPNKVSFGPYTGPAVARFTAPAAGVYNITAAFQTDQIRGSETSDGTTGYVYIGGANAYTQELFDPGAAQFGTVANFTDNNVTLTSGETVDFVVGNGAFTTQVDATVTKAGP